MIYGLSLLIALLGLVLTIPAARKLLYIRDVRRNSETTTGTVLSTPSATGWLWTAQSGNQDRPRVRYISPRGTELIFDITISSFIPVRNYEPGQAVEVVYDRDMPGRAFAAPEARTAARDLWTGLAALVLAIILWVVGRVYNLPF